MSIGLFSIALLCCTAASAQYLVDAEHYTEDLQQKGILEWLFGSEEAVEPEVCESCKCGRVTKVLTDNDSKVVGGKETIVNQYPWMAALLYDGKFYCGASLANANYLITAAHCLEGFDAKKITVVLMDHDRLNESETSFFTRKTEMIMPHPLFNPFTLNNDIGLIKLDKPVDFEDGIMPVCLPSIRENTYAGDLGMLVGWGRIKEGGDVATALQELPMPIMSNEECKETGYGSFRITDKMLCAGYLEGEKGACHGDSGGPLHAHNGTKHELAGVVSWGVGCARPNYPTVFARVTRFLNWVYKNTRGSCYCQD